MFTYKDACHISCFIPFRFIRHVIINHFTVYLQVLKTNVFHFPFFVIAYNHGNFRILPRVGDVFKQNVFNASTGSCAVLLIKEDAQVDQLALSEILYPDILKTDIANQVIVSRIDGEAALIIQLLFFMIQNIYIDIIQVFQNFRILCVSVDTNEYGVCYVRPRVEFCMVIFLQPPVKPIRVP